MPSAEGVVYIWSSISVQSCEVEGTIIFLERCWQSAKCEEGVCVCVCLQTAKRCRMFYFKNMQT